MSDHCKIMTCGQAKSIAWKTYMETGSASDVGKALWEAYEHMITTGKLRVVGTVKRLQVQESPHGFLDRCSACSAVLSPMDVWCPGCGEKIEP